MNLSEPGAAAVMAALLDAGLGIEAGVADVEDVERLRASGLAGRVLRVLVEPFDPPVEDAVRIAGAIHGALDAAGVGAPRLEHADGAATWVLIADAVRRGCDTRVGLEDTTTGPHGARAEDNAALVRAARALL